METDGDQLSHLRGHLLASHRPGSRRGRGEAGDDETRWWPTYLLLWMLVLAASGFCFAFRGLPLWFDGGMALIMVFTLGMLWLTRSVDPGMVPPGPFTDPVVLALESHEDGIPHRDCYTRDPRGQWQRCLPPPPPPPPPQHPPQQSQQPDGGGDSGGGCSSQTERYCRTCNVWRAPRVSHCNVCGHCMERYDHHCHLIGACVARRNHRFFAAFLLGCQAGAVWLAAGAGWRLRDIGFPGAESWQRAEAYALLALAIVYVHHAALMCFGLGHCCSIVLDVTTRDLLLPQPQPPPPVSPHGTHPVCCAGWPGGWCGARCCSGQRSPRRLAAAWHYVCCAPVRWRRDVLREAALITARKGAYSGDSGDIEWGLDRDGGGGGGGGGEGAAVGNSVAGGGSWQPARGGRGSADGPLTPPPLLPIGGGGGAVVGMLQRRDAAAAPGHAGVSGGGVNGSGVGQEAVAWLWQRQPEEQQQQLQQQQEPTTSTLEGTGASGGTRTNSPPM